MTTPNYGMTLPDDNSDMSDTTSLDATWAIIEGIPRPTSGATLPTDPTGRDVGDRFYHTDLKSMFVLIEIDTFWGCIWRPVQARFGPWITVPVAVLTDSVNYSLSNLAYKISNRGRISFRGAIVAVGGYVDFEATNIQLVLLQTLPIAIRPKKNNVFNLPLYDIQFTEIEMGRMNVVSDGTMSQVTWNKLASASVNTLSFDGVSWTIGSNTGYGTNL